MFITSFSQVSCLRPIFVVGIVIIATMIIYLGFNVKAHWSERSKTFGGLIMWVAIILIVISGSEMYIINHYFRTYFGVPITSDRAQRFENRPKVIQRLLDSRTKYQIAEAKCVQALEKMNSAARQTENDIAEFIFLQEDLRARRENMAIEKEQFDHDLLAAYYAGYKAEALAMK